MQEINRNSILVAQSGGGLLDLVSEDGEILAQLPIPEGRHKPNRWLELQGPGQQIQVASGVVVFHPTTRVGILDFGAAKYESAANPDFRVTTAQRQARDFELRLRKMEVAQQRLHRREEIINRVADTEEAALIERQFEAPDPGKADLDVEPEPEAKA